MKPSEWNLPSDWNVSSLIHIKINDKYSSRFPCQYTLMYSNTGNKSSYNIDEDPQGCDILVSSCIEAGAQLPSDYIFKLIFPHENYCTSINISLESINCCRIKKKMQRFYSIWSLQGPLGINYPTPRELCVSMQQS